MEIPQLEIHLSPWQNHARTWMSVLLIFSDLLSLLLAGTLAIIARLLIGDGWQVQLYAQVIGLAIICLLAYSLRDLYPAIGLEPPEEIKLLSWTTTLSTFFFTGLTFFARNAESYSRLTVGLTWLFSLPMVPLGRALVRSVGASVGIWGEAVALIGSGEQSRQLLDLLLNHPQYGLKPVLVFDGDSQSGNTSDLCSVPVLPVDEDILDEDISKIIGVKKAILIVNEVPEKVTHALARNQQGGFRSLITVPEFKMFGSISGPTKHFGTFVGVKTEYKLLSAWGKFNKRAMDVIFALLSLLFFSPIFIILALTVNDN